MNHHLVNNAILRGFHFLFGILDVEHDLMQLPFGKFKFTFVCILLIHGQAFVTADIKNPDEQETSAAEYSVIE